MRRLEALAWRFRGESHPGRGIELGKGRAWSRILAVAGVSDARPSPVLPFLRSPPSRPSSAPAVLLGP